MSNWSKVIIEHSDTKRVISGPFNICGSLAALREVARQILAATESEESPFSYGWVQVVLAAPQHSIANTSPIGWDEAFRDPPTSLRECPSLPPITEEE